MNELRRAAGRVPRETRPKIPAVSYHDEISDEAFRKIRAAVADINDPNHKVCLVDGLNYPSE